MKKLEVEEKRILIFKNSQKKEDKYPDYRGGLTLEGMTYNIALWVMTAQNGSKFMSGTIQPLENTDKQMTSEKPNDLPF
jgi:uncharacterized protein (DUF736 family)